MRWKAGLVLILLVAVALLGAHFLQRYRQQELERQTQDVLEKLSLAYREGKHLQVVELANELLDGAYEFEERPRVLQLKARALSTLGGRNADEVWRQIVDECEGFGVVGEALVALASSAAADNNVKEARGLYEKTIEEFPDSDWARKARAALRALEGGSQDEPPSSTGIVSKSPTRKPPDVAPVSTSGNFQEFMAGKPNRYNESYRVEWGDRLITIAKERGTTLEHLQRLNPGLVTQILEGQSIIVPKKGGLRVVIDLSDRSLTVFSQREGSQGDRLTSYPIGLPQRPERKEPGEYTAGPRMIRYEPREGGEFGTLGSRWIELRKAENPLIQTQVAVHGTNAPEALATPSPQNGIRMRNEDVEQLFSLIVPGTAFTIKE